MVIRTLEDMRKEGENFIKMSEVGLWLYNYEDIFSDFDPRPYSQRALSEDFLTEARKLVKERASGQLQLRFYIPAKLRDAEKEKTIKARLRDHFRKHSLLLKEEASSNFKKGGFVAVLGLAFMFSSAIVRTIVNNSMWHNLLLVLLEPSGWFMAWYGFDKLIEIFSEHKPDIDFYGRMAESEIEFMSY